jgi:hypothetical protein
MARYPPHEEPLMHQYDVVEGLQAEAARQPSPVHEGVTVIEVARERLSAAVAALEDRLQPVLCPVGPDEHAPLREAHPAPARSDVAAVLFTNGELLDGQAARLGRLLARLEV